MSHPRYPEAYALTVDGPTDLDAEELAERKRLAAVDYHKAELGKLRDTLKALQKRIAQRAADDKANLANQRQMIVDEEAALAAVKGN